MKSNNQSAVACLLHLSALSQYFFPLGNFIFPIVIWASYREHSAYVDRQGKRAINFHLSMFLYSVVLVLIAAPIILAAVLKATKIGEYGSNYRHGHFHLDHLDLSQLTGWLVIAAVATALLLLIQLAEFFLIIYAAAKASSGADFRYPAAIPFLKENDEPIPEASKTCESPPETASSTALL